MTTTSTTWRTAIGFAAVALTTCLALSAPGQENRRAAEQARPAGQQTMQTGNGMLSLSAAMPAETRVGEAFNYTIKVTNASDNVTLHDIELKQQKADGFTIDSTKMQSQEQQQQQQQRQQQGQRQQGQQDSGGQGGDASNERITIDKLEPGESRVIEVRATADQEGELRSCLAIVNYVPSLCLTSRVIKPELELTKVAPERANRCEVIELAYSVKNGGTGDVGSFIISDSLGEGLATIEGESELQFQVDGLKAGDTRKFVARVYAQRPGKFSSRAVAKAKDSDLSSRSQQTSTEVVAADLSVEVEGPNRLYGEQLARFTARVTNTGNAPAEDVRVAVMWPEATSLVDVGEPRMQQSGDTSRQRNQGQPTELTSQSDQQRPNQQRSSQQRSDQQQSEAQKSEAQKSEAQKSEAQKSEAQKSEAQKSEAQKSEEQKSEEQQTEEQKSEEQPSKTDQSGVAYSDDQQLVFQQSDNQRSANQQSANQQSRDQQRNQIDVQMREQDLVIERLEPGQTAVFEYAVRPRGVEELPTRVVATTICSVAEANEEARSEITAMAMAKAKVVRLPALQVVVLDDKDPVAKESQVVYSIRVWNEGDAKDSKVQLEAELPEGLEFVSAQGPTEENVEGSTIRFEPIETLNPGDRADFKVVAKGTGEGEVVFSTKLTSEAQKDEVTSEEPTTLFDQEAQN